MRELTPADGAAAVLGGAVLGGGGGGDPQWGHLLAGRAFEAGRVMLASVDDIPDDALVFTAALVGAPGAQGAHVSVEDYWQAFELLSAACGSPAAVISNENGGLATVNGWYQAARAGLPVLDCPGNGRAHPTGLMGALDLDRVAGYEATQTAVGGQRRSGVSIVVRGQLATCSRLVRQAAVEAGGLVAVARNPALAGHVARHGASGAISQALALGHELISSTPGPNSLQAACRFFGSGAIARICEIDETVVHTQGGFDCGLVTMREPGGSANPWRLALWNEYIAAEAGGVAVAAFPDLITTFDLLTGLPVSTAAITELKPGHPIGLLIVPHGELRLATTMYREDLLEPVREAAAAAFSGASGPGSARDG